MEKRREPAIAIPTINPFTGKKFASKEEKEAFVQEQKSKREETLAKRQEKADARGIARTKILKFFSDNGITEEDLHLFFRHRL